MPAARARHTLAGSPGMARNAAMMGGCTLASRLLGLARDMGMAWLLGGSAAADALVAAMRLPHVLRRLLGEGSLSMTLTATLMQERQSAALPLRELAQALSWRLGLLLTGLTLAGMGLAPWLAAVLAPGFDAAQAEAVVHLLRLCLPYVLAAGMAALGMAVLHSMQIFWLPALSPVLFNVVMLLCTLVAALGPWPPASILAMGMVAGGLVQWAAQGLVLRRVLRRVMEQTEKQARSSSSGQELPAPAEPAQGRDRAFNAAGAAKRCLRRLPAGVVGAAAPQLAMLAAMALASGLGSGQTAALYYAERILELPQGLVAAGLGMASLPALSALAVQHDRAGFSQCLGTALRWAVLLSLPAAAGLYAVAPELIRLLLEHGAFDARQTALTVQALRVYVFALPAFALSRALLVACNALARTGSTARSAVGVLVLTLALGGVLRHSLPLSWQDVVPPLAVTLALWLQTAYLWQVVARQHTGFSLRHCGLYGQNNGGTFFSRCPVLAFTLAALAAGVVARLVLDQLTLPAPAALLLAVFMGAGAWFVCLLLCGQEDVQRLRQWRHKKSQARKNSGPTRE